MRNIFKLLSLFLVLAVFTNCQKDDLKEAEGRHFGPDLSPIRYLYGNDALKAKERLRAAAVRLKSSIAGFDGQKSNGWALDFTQVMFVSDSTGNIGYTYLMTHPKMADNQFYNLVLTEDANMNTSITRVEYTMSQDYYTSYSTGSAAGEEFEGSITFVPINSNRPYFPDIEPVQLPVPAPQPVIPVDLCGDPITIVVGPKPGSGGGGGLAQPGQSGIVTWGGNGNGSGRIPNESLEFVECWYTRRVLCSAGTPGHYGNNPDCDAKDKGYTVLINRCAGKSLTPYDAKSDAPAPGHGVLDPCRKYTIGVLFPDYLAGVDNCNDLKAKSDDAAFLAKMTEMRTGMSGTTETGYAMYATGEKYSPKQYGNPNVANGSNVAITYDSTRDCTGYMHCHLSAANKNNYGVFSIDDLEGFGQIVSNSSAQVKEFTMYVVTVKGNFAIKIRNKAKFLEAIIKLKTDHDNYQKIFKKYVSASDEIAIQIKGFLQFLESEPKFKAGTMELYKSDYNFKNWEKHSLDSHTAGKVNIDKC